mgnify:CR=1 FL=1
MENDTLTPTAQDLIDEISVAFIEKRRPPVDSFTLTDFMELNGVNGETTALRYLDNLVISGKLSKVKIGNRNYYYRKGGA